MDSEFHYPNRKYKRIIHWNFANPVIWFLLFARAVSCNTPYVLERLSQSVFSLHPSNKVSTQSRRKRPKITPFSISTTRILQQVSFTSFANYPTFGKSEDYFWQNMYCVYCTNVYMLGGNKIVLNSSSIVGAQVCLRVN